MNFKKTLLSLFAAGTLLVSGGGIALGQSATSTAYGSVTVTADGTFNAVFCDHFTFEGVTINSSNPTPTTTSQMSICYTDTQAHRGPFRTYVQATDFYGSTAVIPASAVKPLTMYNVGQIQWGEVNGNDIGDIGAMTGAANYSDGGYVNAGQAQWNGGSLATPQYVNYAWAGVGTSGSVSTMDLQLKVPSTVPSDTYTSTFTLNVTPAQP